MTASADSPLPYDTLPVRTALVLALLAVIHRGLIAALSTTLGADSAFYLWTAEDWAGGEYARALRSFSSFHPLYPILIAGLGSAFDRLETAGVLVSVISSGLGTIPLFFLVRSLWNGRIAFWTGMLYAFHPTLSLESADVMITGLFLSLVLTSLALWHSARTGASCLRYPLAGLVAGLAYLARPEGIALPLFFAIGAASGGIRLFRNLRGLSPEPVRNEIRSLLTGGLAAGTLFLATALPYLLWLRTEHGGWRLTARSSAVELWKNLKTAADRPDPAAPHLSDARTVPPAPPVPPAPFFPTLGSKFARAFYDPLLPLIPLGLLACRRQGGRWSALLPLWGMALTFWIPTIVAFALDPNYRPSHRYLLPGVTLVLPWMAAGFLAIRDAGNRGPAGTSRKKWTAAAVILLLGLMTVKTLRPRRGDEASFLSAGRWIREQPLPQPRRVMSTSEKIAYYGNCRLVPRPDRYDSSHWVFRGGSAPTAWEPDRGQDQRLRCTDRVRRTLDDFQSEGASLWVVDEVSSSRWPPDFLDGLRIVGFEPVAMFGPPDLPGTVPVRIYRLRPTSR